MGSIYLFFKSWSLQEGSVMLYLIDPLKFPPCYCILELFMDQLSTTGLKGRNGYTILLSHYHFHFCRKIYWNCWILDSFFIHFPALSIAGKANLERSDLEPALKALKDRLMTKNVVCFSICFNDLPMFHIYSISTSQSCWDCYLKLHAMIFIGWGDSWETLWISRSKSWREKIGFIHKGIFNSAGLDFIPYSNI